MVCGFGAPRAPGGGTSGRLTSKGPQTSPRPWQPPPPAGPSTAANSSPSFVYDTKITKRRAGGGTPRSSPCSTRAASQRIAYPLSGMGNSGHETLLEGPQAQGVDRLRSRDDPQGGLGNLRRLRTDHKTLPEAAKGDRWRRTRAAVRPPARKGRALEAALPAQVSRNPDLTLEKHRELFEDEHGIAVSVSSVSRAFSRLRLPLKKVPPGPRARRGSTQGMARGGRRDRPAYARVRGRVRDAHLHDAPSGAGTQGRKGLRFCAAQPRKEHDPHREHGVRRNGAVHDGGGFHHKGGLRGLRREGAGAVPVSRADGDHSDPAQRRELHARWNRSTVLDLRSVADIWTLRVKRMPRDRLAAS